MTESFAVVLERTGSTLRLLQQGREITAVLRGSLKHRSARDRVAVGDRVELEGGDPEGTVGIVGVRPRRNVLERRTPDGRAAQPIAANVDQVFVLAAVARPDPLPRLIDRLLVIAELNTIPAALVINKIDLGDPEPLAAGFRRAGYEVHLVSAQSGEGVAAVAERMAGRESILAGPSGVGKSSLLNRIQPGLGLRTAEVSRRILRGRHTTAAAVMVPLDQGGFVVDTPGFSEAGLWGMEPRDLGWFFREFRPFAEHCHYPDCRHLTEPNCAVRAAAAAGTIAADRLDSYHALLQEVGDAPRHWE